MPTFKFSKLVRDKIVDNQIASGAKPTYRQLDEKAHKRELVNKIIEEASELITAPADEIAAEIADVQQALDDLKEKYNLTDQQIKTLQAKKNERNGAFKKGLFIDYLETDEADPWTAYYRKNGDRYPEIE